MGQYCLHINTAGPGGHFRPFLRLSCHQGLCERAILHQKHQMVGWLKQASIPVRNRSLNKVRANHPPRCKGPTARRDSCPTPPQPLGQGTTKHQAGDKTQSPLAKPRARADFIYEGARSPGGHGAGNSEMLKTQVSNRNHRSEASSYFVTSGAVVVCGLIWKGQTLTEDRKQRSFPKGPGFGSSLAATQSVQGEAGICILPFISGLHRWEHLVT